MFGQATGGGIYRTACRHDGLIQTGPDQALARLPLHEGEAEVRFVETNMTTMITQKITPFLWFDDQAEEAVKLYTSIFKNSKIGTISRYGEEVAQVADRPKGSVLTVAFQLDSQEFVALNGGPQFKFTEAVSFVVNCDSQEEVNYYWEKLSAGGEESRCGWLKDEFGLSWQVVPRVLIEMLEDKDPTKSQRVMHAMLQMDKIDIPTLKKAYEQK
jgi:predicted 3-demethylubiquinone-9 3-methyltransferase (glyoxalase superfamily)